MSESSGVTNVAIIIIVIMHDTITVVHVCRRALLIYDYAICVPLY